MSNYLPKPEAKDRRSLGRRIGAGVTGAVLFLTGCSTEAKPASPTPSASASETPGGVTPSSEATPSTTPSGMVENPSGSPSTSSSETETAAVDLSPGGLYELSQQKGGMDKILEAIRIPKDTPPEEYIKLKAKYIQAALNAGTTRKEYFEWNEERKKNNISGTIGPYSEYLFKTYYSPMLSQLEGSKISSYTIKDDKKEAGDYMDIAHRASLMMNLRYEGGTRNDESNKWVKEYIVSYVVSNIQRTGDDSVAYDLVLTDTVDNDAVEMADQTYDKGNHVGFAPFSGDPIEKQDSGISFNRKSKTMVPASSKKVS